MSARSSQAWGPAGAAAQRAGARQAATRAYAVPDDVDLTGEALVCAATDALRRVACRAEAARVLQTAVRDLGGAVVPARLAETNPQAREGDVSLGVGEPLLVVVAETSVAALQIERHLPALLQAALETAERLDRTSPDTPAREEDLR